MNYDDQELEAFSRKLRRHVAPQLAANEARKLRSNGVSKALCLAIVVGWALYLAVYL